MKNLSWAALAIALLSIAMLCRADDEEGAAIAPGKPSYEQSGIRAEAPRALKLRPELRAYAKVLDAAPLTELGGRTAQARAALDTAKARLAASRTAYARAQDLYRDGRTASLADVQSAEAAYRTNEAARSAAQAELDGVKASAAQAWGGVIAGWLADEAAPLARLIDGRLRLVQVTLTPGSALAAPPARAELGIEGARAPLELVSPAPRTDPRIQGLSFYYTAPARPGVLPGMELLAYLPSGAPQEGVAVPGRAVVWYQDRAWIYLKNAPGKYSRVAIATDRPAPGGGYFVTGLPAGSEVVTEGAQLLLSQEFHARIKTED